ncbi:phospholipase D family protein [Poseidonocella sp. HB161398]|uniref:phospholipase D family protein n=1 Tax=Poseidonocella sp. HB161398 TaxID=2320855 RepID=UPI00110862DA|nr:phospholipase D family protein [Poseidonocella sp. HB161398]
MGRGFGGTGPQRRGGRLGLAAVLALLIGACAPWAEDYPKTESHVLPDTGKTFLAGQARALGDPGKGLSGIRLLPDGPESLALRLLLADRAERSIDAQYYLLHDDTAGHLFAWHLLQAADRGVRVRLLIDDMDTSGYDAMTAALDRHPNIEIRLYNPFRRGPGKMLASAFEFDRINRRMHNKSMTFDDVVTIVGGRNIGDEYFAARSQSNYNDLDLLGAGPVASEVSTVFDSYWNSEHAVPVGAVARNADLLSLDDARETLARLAVKAGGTEYGNALIEATRDAFRQDRLALDWVPVEVVADPVEKSGGAAPEGGLLAERLLPHVKNAQEDLFVASAYFVPRAAGVELLSGLSERGVKVTVLTNSMDSTDVLPVYSHYSRDRKEMLEAGIQLWELKADGPRPDRARLGLGQSLSSLHTKAFAIDRRYLFVGSFNWDPRSVRLNTEMGVLISSPRIASEAVRQFQEGLQRNAYQLRLGTDGQIEWLDHSQDGKILVRQSEPADSSWRSFKSRVYGILPIGGQL